MAKRRREASSADVEEQPGPAVPAGTDAESAVDVEDQPEPPAAAEPERPLWCAHCEKEAVLDLKFIHRCARCRSERL